MTNELPLINLKNGQKGVIISIAGGWRATKRLADLGLTPETTVEVLKKAPFSGPLLIEVRGSKLILGKGLAAKVLVRLK
jgi:Fe2+ transport system protein FeoA